MVREPGWTWWDEARVVARRHARGASDAADDLAQELAVAALERGAGPTGAPERPGAWLERVGRNAAIDGWRVEHRRRELVGGWDAPAQPVDPEAGVLLRERRGIVRRALAGLPRPLRRAALARFHGELPFDEIAGCLGTETVTARTRVHRALERLRARVSGLRAICSWFPGAPATALGLALVSSLARPAPPVAEALAEAPRAVTATRARRVAEATTPAVTPPGHEIRRAPAHGPADGGSKSPPVAAVQRFSFDDDEITAELARPESDSVMGLGTARHESLIELRRTFTPEIEKTFEDL